MEHSFDLINVIMLLLVHIYGSEARCRRFHQTHHLREIFVTRKRHRHRVGGGLQGLHRLRRYFVTGEASVADGSSICSIVCDLVIPGDEQVLCGTASGHSNRIPKL